jgi:AhpD family alkylhydroperoxidase
MKGNPMQPRLNVQELSPEGFKAMVALERIAQHSGLEKSLIHLVKLRASQINGCAYCIDMHTKDARLAGETEQRLFCLSVWRECPFYTDRERAAMEWTEEVTLISNNQVPDDVFERVRKHFSDAELVNLNYAVIAINAWNRIAITFRATPGSYQAPAK